MNNLPTGWAWTELAQVCTSITDGDHQAPPQVPLGIPFLVIGNIRTQRLDFTDCRHVPSEYFESLNPVRRPQKGDVLYSLVGSYGISVLVTDDSPFCVQRHIGILRPSPEISPAFLALALSSRAVFDQATQYATGTAQLTVPLSGLRRIRVPLPPRLEQERIVAAIEEQFSRLDAGVAALERVRQNLKRMRSAILQRAVTPPVDTPSVFARDLFSWASGKRAPSARSTGGQFPVFGGNGITGHSNKILKAEETIVIGRVGALCGNVYLTGGPAWITDNAIYAQSHAESILLPYAVLVFRSARLRDRAAGTGQPFVNQIILNEVTVPLPSKEHQAEIVARHDATEEAISHIEHQLQTLDQRQIRLRSSILAAAFSGNLVAQDPKDEPALVLLERIAAERTASNSHKPTQTRKPRASGERITA